MTEEHERFITPYYMKVQIFGERCSGTNYVEDLLTHNCPTVKVVSEYGHKHLFNGFKKRKGPDEQACYIFVYRNPYDWLRSVCEKPHHSQLWDLPFSTFIRTRPWMCDVYEGPGFKDDYSGVIEQLDGTVLDLRNYKNRLFDSLWLPGRSYSLRYEDLRKEPEATMRKIGDVLGFPVNTAFMNVSTSRKEGGVQYTRKSYGTIDQADLDYINARLDWGQETRIGYHRITTPGYALDHLLESLYG